MAGDESDEALEDTLDLLGNPEAMAELRQSELERERGDTVPLDPDLLTRAREVAGPIPRAPLW